MDGMLVHRRVSPPSIKFAGTHLYTWVDVQISMYIKERKSLKRIYSWSVEKKGLTMARTIFLIFQINLFQGDQHGRQILQRRRRNQQLPSLPSLRKMMSVLWARTTRSFLPLTRKRTRWRVRSTGSSHLGAVQAWRVGLIGWLICGRNSRARLTLLTGKALTGWCSSAELSKCLFLNPVLFDSSLTELFHSTWK